MSWATTVRPGAASDPTDAFAGAWETIVDSWPKLAAAVAVIAIGVIAGRIVRSGLRRTLARRNTLSFVTVMSKLGGWLVVTAAVLIAVTIVFPSVRPVDLLAGAGLFSIAIGFAFKDIFENLLAGMLLLFRQPFESGDQVEVSGAEGTVDRITIRETRIVTYDGQLKIIPNSDVYKNPIRVQTASDRRRLEFMVGVAYEDDMRRARDVIVAALARTDGVAATPGPEALMDELAVSTVNIRARFWAPSRQLDAAHVRSRAMANVKTDLDAAGIQMPTEIITVAATSTLAAALGAGRAGLTPSGAFTSSAAPVGDGATASD